MIQILVLRLVGRHDAIIRVVSLLLQDEVDQRDRKEDE